MTNRERIIKTNPADLLCDMQWRHSSCTTARLCVLELLGFGGHCLATTCDECIYAWLGREEEKHDYTRRPPMV